MTTPVLRWPQSAGRSSSRGISDAGGSRVDPELRAVRQRVGTSRTAGAISRGVSHEEMRASPAAVAIISVSSPRLVRYDSAFYQPTVLSGGQSFGRWQVAAPHDALDRATDCRRTARAEHGAPKFDPAVREALDACPAARWQEIGAGDP